MGNPIGRKTEDITGKRFSFLIAVKRDYQKQNKNAMWICRCDCGNEVIVASNSLRSGKQKSCGCMKYKLVSESKVIDLTGRRFGRLVALDRVGKNKNGSSIWKCRCDCGNECIVSQSNLCGGRTKSCGCLHIETFTAKKHCQSKTRLYRIWRAMKERCGRQKAKNYKYYGAKGVSVCNEWSESFESFRDWAMANGYKDTLVIDRIDSSKNYIPSNCRWITQAENARLAVKERIKKNGDNKGIVR